MTPFPCVFIYLFIYFAGFGEGFLIGLGEGGRGDGGGGGGGRALEGSQTKALSANVLQPYHQAVFKGTPFPCLAAIIIFIFWQMGHIHYNPLTD